MVVEARACAHTSGEKSDVVRFKRKSATTVEFTSESKRRKSRSSDKKRLNTHIFTSYLHVDSKRKPIQHAQSDVMVIVRELLWRAVLKRSELCTWSRVAPTTEHRARRDRPDKTIYKPRSWHWAVGTGRTGESLLSFLMQIKHVEKKITEHTLTLLLLPTHDYYHQQHASKAHVFKRDATINRAERENRLDNATRAWTWQITASETVASIVAYNVWETNKKNPGKRLSYYGRQSWLKQKASARRRDVKRATVKVSTKRGANTFARTWRVHRGRGRKAWLEG